MNNLNYGVVGNCRSAALISNKGSVDWFCLPDFNSSSIFGKIIDKKIGGEFSIIVDSTYKIKQKYIDNTNILSTVFNNGTDAFELIDFMPRYQTDRGDYYNPSDLIRYIKYISGEPNVKFAYNPKLAWAEYKTSHVIEDDFIKSFTTEGIYDSIYLYSSIGFHILLNQENFKITKDEFFLLSYNQKIEETKLNKVYLKLQRTKEYWYSWVDRTIRLSKYNREITRSALVLKLLTFQKSGSILAAVTTSIPESIGGERNWDYRYCWIRDASKVIKILMVLGHKTSALRFLDYIYELIPVKNEKIQIMYGIRGEKVLTETILEHLEGYEGSKPVRVGNSGFELKQNDIYGVLMDVIYQHFQLHDHDEEGTEELWTLVRSIAKIVSNNWQKPDLGIWEINRKEEHFTFSKVLCWVAINRGVKIAEKLYKTKYLQRWRKLKDEIKDDIIKNAWSEKLQSFKQSYECDEMDASNLLMEKYGFIDAKDPKYISTVEATKKHLLKNGLMYRYKQKDESGQLSSGNTICSFWLIHSLCKIGKSDEAREMFEEILKCSNHLGLFSENLDFDTKRLLGNFPHGSTHLALIEAAMVLSQNNKLDYFK